MASEKTPEPAETIYVAEASWGPPFLALALTLCILGAYLWWPYAVVGAAIAIAGFRSWYGQSADEIDDLPRRQEPATDVVPPLTRSR